MPNGKCTFNRLWLSNKEYADWAREDTKNKHVCFCCVCKKSIDLRTMGESALTSHAKGKKHERLIEASKPAVSITSFINKVTTSNKSSAAVLEPSTQSTSAVQSTSTTTAISSPSVTVGVNSFCTKTDVLTSEVLWTLNIVNSHQSFKSCDGSGNLFQTMFPDSDIAKGFQCGEGKSRYLATFGIAPYFNSLLKKQVKSNSAYVLLFDESMNKQMKQQQMDIHVRFWRDEMVTTQYFTSVFLGHTYASVLYESLEPIITDLGHRHLLQLSMDGPNVNWKLHDDIQKEMQKQTGKQMLQAGSCGIHTLHNAFRAGCGAARWEIENLLCALYQIFLDSPARREDFTSVTGTSVFPLKFCKVRWLENIEPAERAIEMMPHLVAYCSAAKAKKVKEPTSDSFQIVKKAIQDPLVISKLQFFVLVAREVQPFLAGYQTDRPMLPFLGEDLGLMLKGLMEKILKPELMKKEANSLSGLVKIDVTKTENHMDLDKISVGFAVERQLRKTGIASDRQKSEFRGACKDFLLHLVKKMLEKSPVTYRLVRLLGWLDPRHMADVEEREHNINKLKKCLNIMHDASRIDDSSCDAAISQFSRFLDTVLSNHTAVFKAFNPSLESDRLDVLLYSHLAKDKKYGDMWTVVRQLLLLSHGQATVERGFSLNKEASTDNISQLGLTARRQIVDHVRNVGGVLKVPITKELLLSASSARSKYLQYLEDQKKEKEAEKASKKRKLTQEKVTELKTKKKRFSEEIVFLEKEADKLAETAENTGQVRFITQSNALRRKAKEKEVSLEDLDKEILEEMERLKDSL